MTLPAAGRHRVSRSRGAGAWALILGATWVSVLHSREDPELDALDRLQLLGSAIVSRRLGCRWPNEPSMGIGQAVGVVVSRPITWGDAVRALLLVGGDPADQRAADTFGLQCLAVPGPSVGVPGGWVDPAAVPDTFRFVHDTLAIGNDLQVPSKHLQGYEDSVELGSVHSLDWAGQGPSR